MTWKISVYKDRDYLGSLPSDTQSILKKSNLTTHGGQNVSYCGLLFHNNHIDLFLPRNSKFQNTLLEKRQLATLVLNTIQQYGEEYDSPLTLEDGEVENQIGGTSLSLIADLLNDYKRNGIYSKRRAINTINSGKPNWNRTISKNTAYPSNGNYIYLDVYTNKRISQSLCDVAKIHYSTINDLSERFSLLLFGNELKVIEQNIPVSSVSNIDGQIYLLEKELINSFSERDIWLIKSLINYLKNVKGDNQSNMKVGIKHFHTVWEFMLSKALNNTVNVNRLIPMPSYKMINGDVVSAPAKGQRLDIVLKHPDESTYAVVDAKYYSATSVSSAPGWPDLVKQFFYAKSLKELIPEATIINAFIFPNVSGPLKSAHMQERETKRLLNTEYGVINCHYVDPITVMEHFVSNRKLLQTSNNLLRK